MTISRAVDRTTWLPFSILIASLLLVTIANAKETVVVTATPTVPHPASYTSRHDFKNTVLRVTNAYRRTHDASPLVWNETLMKYARNWADQCLWEHSNGPYGENLAAGYPNASAAIMAWGNEGAQYNYHQPTGFTEATGHFTQLVWKSTKQVGCAAVDCGYKHHGGGSGNRRREGEIIVARAPPAQGWFVVCEYLPPGNVIGNFESNVKPGNASGSSGSHASSGSRPGVGMMLLALGAVGLAMALYT